MYCIIDLTQDPPVKVPGAEFETEAECFLWIDENGDVSIYTITEE